MKVLNTALLDKIVRRIVVALQPETIYLYGSHAYGQPHEDSDVDLLVVLREATRSGHEGAVEAYRALRGLCVPVEVQVVTRKEFERPGSVAEFRGESRQGEGQNTVCLLSRTKCKHGF